MALIETIRLPTVLLAANSIALIICISQSAPKVLTIALAGLGLLLLIWEAFSYLGAEIVELPADLLNDLPDAAVETTLSGTILRFNEPFRTLMGGAAITGGSVEAAFRKLHTRANVREPADQVLEALLQSDSLRYSDTISMTDGRVYERVSRPTREDDRRLWVVRDITHLVDAKTSRNLQQSLLEEDAARMTEMAEQLYVAKAELESKQKELAILANTDSLTGLCSRRHFLEQGEKLLSQKQTPSGIIMMDIDGFKRVNDYYGHAAGDAVLKALGTVISKSIQEEDIAGRLGGEEFAIVCPQLDQGACKSMADRLRKSIDNLIVNHGGHGITFSCSFGIATTLTEEKSLEKALDRADKSLYRAKQDSRQVAPPADAGKASYSAS